MSSENFSFSENQLNELQFLLNGPAPAAEATSLGHDLSVGSENASGTGSLVDLLVNSSANPALGNGLTNLFQDGGGAGAPHNPSLDLTSPSVSTHAETSALPQDDLLIHSVTRNHPVAAGLNGSLSALGSEQPTGPSLLSRSRNSSDSEGVSFNAGDFSLDGAELMNGMDDLFSASAVEGADLLDSTGISYQLFGANASPADASLSSMLPVDLLTAGTPGSWSAPPAQQLNATSSIGQQALSVGASKITLQPITRK